jgi:hypothetical protein
VVTALLVEAADVAVAASLPFSEVRRDGSPGVPSKRTSALLPVGVLPPGPDGATPGCAPGCTGVDGGGVLGRETVGLGIGGPRGVM